MPDRYNDPQKRRGPLDLVFSSALHEFRTCTYLDHASTLHDYTRRSRKLKLEMAHLCIIGSCSFIPIPLLMIFLLADLRRNAPFSIFHRSLLLFFRREFHYWDLFFFFFLILLRIPVNHRELVDRCFRVKKKDRFLLVACFLLTIIVFDIVRIRWEGRLFDFFLWRKFRWSAVKGL